MSDEPTTVEGWERLAREHSDCAKTERLGHLRVALEQTARRCWEKAAELREVTR